MTVKTIRTAIAAVLFSATSAVASPISPVFETFGDLTGATFGGTGIPTDPTAITTFDGIAGDTITIALSATQRFFNPALGNDGAGTYTALAGTNDGTPGNPGTTSTWNFNYFLSVASRAGRTLADYDLIFYYDLDPGVGTSTADMGTFNFSLSPNALEQGSQNATFGFLGGTPPVPGVTPPAFTAFDTNAPGEYSFLIESQTYNERVAINVNVSAVPLPAAGWMLVAGLGGLAYLGRRRR